MKNKGWKPTHISKKSLLLAMAVDIGLFHITLRDNVGNQWEDNPNYWQTLQDFWEGK